MNTDNWVNLKGRMSIPTLLRTGLTERIYEATIKVKRGSGIIDSLIIRFNENLLTTLPQEELFVEIKGFLQSCKYQGKTYIYVWAKDITPLAKKEYLNEVFIKGFICKKNEIRETPLTCNKIMELFIEVNPYKTYYLPLIAWNNVAYALSFFPVKTYISLKGRLQSRNYTKVLEDGSSTQNTAYEVSIVTLYY